MKATRSRTIGDVLSAMALGLLGFAVQPASATVTASGCAGGDLGDACSLSELIGGGSLTINDKLFSNFDLSNFAGRALNASVIRVDAIDSLYSPGFTLVDTGSTLSFANGDSSFNNFSFDVAVTSAQPFINGSSLAVAVGNLTGPGSSANVVASAFDPSFSNLLALNNAYCDTTLSCANSTLTSAANIFPSVSAISVVAGIDVIADAAGTAQLGNVSMIVSQVPEPSSVAILAVGLGAVGVFARAGRRKQAAA